VPQYIILVSQIHSKATVAPSSTTGGKGVIRSRYVNGVLTIIGTAKADQITVSQIAPGRGKPDGLMPRPYFLVNINGHFSEVFVYRLVTSVLGVPPAMGMTVREPPKAARPFSGPIRIVINTKSSAKLRPARW